MATERVPLAEARASVVSAFDAATRMPLVKLAIGDAEYMIPAAEAMQVGMALLRAAADSDAQALAWEAVGRELGEAKAAAALLEARALRRARGSPQRANGRGLVS